MFKEKKIWFTFQIEPLHLNNSLNRFNADADDTSKLYETVILFYIN